VNDLPRRLFAEWLGSLLLSGVVIGSGILASRLANGNDAVALLANTGATAAILFVLITALGPISGAHAGDGLASNDQTSGWSMLCHRSDLRLRPWCGSRSRHV
jgi:hypothetical protein